MTGLARLAASWKAWLAANSLGDLGRVDVVIGAEVGSLDIDQLVAGHDAAVEGLAYAFLDTAGMNSLGMTPPLMELMNSKSS